jgi:hypothetical protein
MKNISLINILKENLIGRQLKVLVKWSNVTQDSSVWKKKQGATQEQFESGDLKYRFRVNRTKNIGTNKIFDIFTIVDVKIYIAEDYDESDEIIIILDGDRTETIDLDTELEWIGDNLYMFKY